jgi:hypothetical protein
MIYADSYAGCWRNEDSSSRAAPEGRERLSEEHPNARYGAEGEGEVFEEALVDAGEDGAAGEGTEDDGGGEEEVELDAVGRDEAEVHHEGDFEPIQDHEEHGGGADKFHSREAHREEVDGHERTGGIGDEGGEAGEDAHGRGEPEAVVGCLSGGYGGRS